MWSKKILDGKNCIQAYSFAPINDNQPTQSEQPKSEINEALLDNICERLSAIEEKINK